MPIQTSYTLTFSDPNKTQIIVVPGSPNGSGKNNYDTSLDLVGPGYTAYGQSIGQNFVKILENFAGPNPPRHAIEGQLWYDTSNPDRKILRINNGELSSARWPSANGIYQQSYDPSEQYLQNVKEGDIWVDTSVNQLKIRSGGEWTVVGPSTTSQENKTGVEVLTIEATTGVFYPIIKNWVDGKVVEIISYYDFTPKIVIDGFSGLRAGVNLTNKVASKFNGLADRANSLEITRGVVIKATEVLKNKIPNNARQTHTGTFVVESGNGLVVKRNSTYPEIRIIADRNNAYVTFTGTDAYMRIGLEDDSYVSFNNTNGAVGINTPPTVLSSATAVLNVNGGASFTNRVGIVASTPTALGLSVTGAASISNNLAVSGGASVTGKTTVSNTLTVVDINASAPGGVIGTVDTPFERIFVENIGRPEGPIVNIYGSVSTATTLENTRTFRIEGVVTSTNTATFNGSQNVTFNVEARRTLISNLSAATVANSATYKLMVLDESSGVTSLEKISKANFLSDIYSSIAHPGMVVPYAGNVPPDGWRWCDGAIYSPANPVYSRLFAVIGYTYGNNAGDFIVPNMTATTFVTTSPGTGTYIQYIIKI